MNTKLDVVQTSDVAYVVDVLDDKWHVINGEDAFFMVVYENTRGEWVVYEHGRFNPIDKGGFDTIGDALAAINNWVVGVPPIHQSVFSHIILTASRNERTGKYTGYTFIAGKCAHITKSEYDTSNRATFAAYRLWIGLPEDIDIHNRTGV